MYIYNVYPYTCINIYGHILHVLTHIVLWINMYIKYYTFRLDD